MYDKNMAYVLRLVCNKGTGFQIDARIPWNQWKTIRCPTVAHVVFNVRLNVCLICVAFECASLPRATQAFHHHSSGMQEENQASTSSGHKTRFAFLLHLLRRHEGCKIETMHDVLHASKPQTGKNEWNGTMHVQSESMDVFVRAHMQSNRRRTCVMRSSMAGETSLRSHPRSFRLESKLPSCIERSTTHTTSRDFSLRAASSLSMRTDARGPPRRPSSMSFFSTVVWMTSTSNHWLTKLRRLTRRRWRRAKLHLQRMEEVRKDPRPCPWQWRWPRRRTGSIPNGSCTD